MDWFVSFSTIHPSALVTDGEECYKCFQLDTDFTNGMHYSEGERIHWFLSDLHKFLISDCCQKGAWNWFHIYRKQKQDVCVKWKRQRAWIWKVRKVESQIFISLKEEWMISLFMLFFLKLFFTVWSLMYQLSTAYFHLQQKLNWRWKFFDVIHNTKRWTQRNLGWSLLRNWSEVICSSNIGVQVDKISIDQYSIPLSNVTQISSFGLTKKVLLEFDYFVIIIIRL